MSLKTGRKGKYSGGSFASRFKTGLAMKSPFSVVVAGEKLSDAAAAKAEIDNQSQSPKDEIPTDTDYSREEVGAFFQRKKLAEEQAAAKKAAEEAIPDEYLARNSLIGPESFVLERLHALSAHPLVGHTRGVGLIGGIELVEDKDSKAQYPVADKVAVRVMNACRTNGVIVRAVPGDGIGICPPLIISDEQIHEMFDGIQRGLDVVAEELAN